MNKESIVQKIWLVFGTFFISISCLFIIPLILLGVTNLENAYGYIQDYFMIYLFTTLLIAIIFLVIYGYWHLFREHNILKRLDSIESKLDSIISKQEIEMPLNPGWEQAIFIN